MNKKHIPIYTCIDDYGLGINHNEVIRKIAEKGIIPGVSTFVGMKNFQPEAEKLDIISKKSDFQIGLHIDFIQFFHVTKRPNFISSDMFCAYLIFLATTGLLKKKNVYILK